MKNLFSLKNKKALLLVVVALFSIIISGVIYFNNTTPSSTVDKIRKSFASKEQPSVNVNLEYNLDESFIDIYLNSSGADVSLIELVFKTKDGAKLLNLQKAELFNDYLKNSASESFRVAGTGGPEAKVLKIGDKVLFARLEIENLTSKDLVEIDMLNSQAVDKNDNLIKLVN